MTVTTLFALIIVALPALFVALATGWTWPVLVAALLWLPVAWLLAAGLVWLGKAFSRLVSG